MDPGRVAVRAAFAYLYLLALVRASGKRTVGESTPFDFVVALVLGDLVDDVLWGEVDAGTFAVAAGALVLVHTALAVLAGRGDALHRLVDGAPVVLLDGGSPAPPGQRQEKVNGKELERCLRRAGYGRDRWWHLAHASLEPDGEISPRERGWARPAPRRDVDRVKGRT